MKKINVMTISLLSYLIIMSYIGWPGRNSNLSYKEYYVIIGVTLAVIVTLHFLRIKLKKMRDRRNKDIS